MSQSQPSAAGSDEFQKNRSCRVECQECSGRGHVVCFWPTIIVPLFGGLLTWLGWREFPTLMQLTNATARESVILLSIGGPILAVYGFWKCIRGQCLECEGTGRAKANANPRPEVPETIGPIITDDHQCRMCDYNVRTLRVGARCPECGERILPPKQASQLRESRQSFRFELWIGIVFTVGLIGSVVFFGSSGAGWFTGIWFIFYIVFKARETLFGQKKRPPLE